MFQQTKLFSVEKLWSFWVPLLMVLVAAPALGSEAELILPPLDGTYYVWGIPVTGPQILWGGMVVCLLGMIFGLVEIAAVKALPAHKAMLEVSNLIFETCKTYMIQQGKMLAVFEVFIGACMIYYFGVLQKMEVAKVALILAWSVLGILGSFGVAWFGIRINTYANSRTAFASLKAKPWPILSIPLRSGMSIGVLLISVELMMMMAILLFVSPANAGACFVGFAIGESLGASVLRICGGIFTKIADIGSDLMKIVYDIKEDDARNPGVIADCAGDNAGDSVGPTADGFETYGVTGVALISFIALAVGQQLTDSGALQAFSGGVAIQSRLILWIFLMRIIMIAASIGSYWINNLVQKAAHANADSMDFEKPLTHLVWITSMVSIILTYLVSHTFLYDLGGTIWFRLATIISCGTVAAAVIPELTKFFTSSKSAHVSEIVTASREGGASLTVLSGLVAGNFSVFWKGMTIVGLMFVAYLASGAELAQLMVYPAVFAFGLVAFGMLSMGPVTIAVDSYGPVTDNAQSVFELSQIETLPNISKEIEKDFGFKPNFTRGKHLLEENDSAGNTFKATAKPVLIGTAVIGATTMIFSIILLLHLKLDLLDPRVLFGIITGGAVVYWFTGASMQAVTTGAYRAVDYIKRNIKLEGTEKASVESSNEVVKICTQFAQAGMVNIFGVIFSLTLAFACFDPTFFASYLISIAAVGLFQAIFMANAGGAWDNAKKVVEVDLKQKKGALHAACVVGDTVGDPFKDTSSVALNPIIKFTTLFGLLAVEIAVAADRTTSLTIGVVFFVIGLVFVWRSFYRMRISQESYAVSHVPASA